MSEKHLYETYQMELKVNAHKGLLAYADTIKNIDYNLSKFPPIEEMIKKCRADKKDAFMAWVAGRYVIIYLESLTRKGDMMTLYDISLPGDMPQAVKDYGKADKRIEDYINKLTTDYKKKFNSKMDIVGLVIDNES